MTAVSQEVAQKILGDVPEDKRFYCSDGRVFKNLAELVSGLKEMKDGTFGYHSNEAKTDFGSWVRDVIGDEELAYNLRDVSRVAAAKIVSDRIAELQPQPAKAPARRRAKRRTKKS